MLGSILNQAWDAQTSCSPFHDTMAAYSFPCCTNSHAHYTVEGRLWLV